MSRRSGLPAMHGRPLAVAPATAGWWPQAPRESDRQATQAHSHGLPAPLECGRPATLVRRHSLTAPRECDRPAAQDHGHGRPALRERGGRGRQ